MEKKLNVFERMMLMKILPREGNFATLRLVRDLVHKLGLSAEEMDEFDVKVDDSGLAKWNAKGNEERTIEMKEKEVECIKEALLKLDKSNKLDMQHYSIYEKFSEVS